MIYWILQDTTATGTTRHNNRRETNICQHHEYA